MSFERPASPEAPRVWKRPDLSAERKEFERVARTLAPEKDQAQFVHDMYEAFSKTSLQELSDEDWAILENTDSWSIAPGDFTRIAELCEKYGRDWQKFKRAFENGEAVGAPTIIRYGDHLHKVGGNTRLMVAKAMGIRPQVLIAEL